MPIVGGERRSTDRLAVLGGTPALPPRSGRRELGDDAVAAVADALRSVPLSTFHGGWRLPAAAHESRPEETVDRVRALLQRAVDREVRADVPISFLLSGGLDSSAITALAAGAAGPGVALRTYSLNPGGRQGGVSGRGDADYAREVARHLATDHREVEVSARELADPELRRRAIEARDAPTGLGEADHSLYRMLREVREHGPVVLSGEGADELFGGYAWCRDSAALRANTFPWIAFHQAGGDRRTRPARGSLLRREVLSALDLSAYVADGYATSVAAVPEPDGEGPLHRRLRRITHLHLTKLIRSLLDRKDRISSALGMEVRVPFCDHHLVEYVFNVPWTTAPPGSPAKYLLRQAVRGLLPRSVVDRVKSPYPATSDDEYVARLRAQVGELTAVARHPAFDLFDRAVVVERLPVLDRASCERLLDFAMWFDLRRPTLVLD